MDLKVEETPTRLKLTCQRPTLDLLRENDAFRYRPTDYWRSPAFEQWKRTQHDPAGPRGWDGYNRLIERTTYGGICFRGHKEALLELCRDLGITVTGTWLRSPMEGLTVDDVPANIIKAPFELDLHQRTCIINLLAAGTGVVKMVVSSGKTAMFAAVAAMIKARIPGARVLYVTPTERLVNQVTTELRKFLPKWKISQAGGGKKDFTGGDVVVATMAMLSRNVDELFKDDWFKSFTVLLVDECHHSTAPSWLKVIRLTPALFRFGASDTVKDERKEDLGLKLTIRGLFGPVRGEVEMAPLIQTGRIARPKLHLVDIEEWSGRYDDVPAVAVPGSPAWCLLNDEWQHGTYVGPASDPEVLDRDGQPTELKGYHVLDLPDRGEIDVESRWCLLERSYDRGIIRFKERNALIVEWAKHFSQQGWPQVIVATRTLHVLILEKLLSTAGLDVTTLTGEHSTKERDQVFKWIVDKPGRVLITPLVKEGVSIPALRAGIVADLAVGPDVARQIIGRFIRKKPTGDNAADVVFFIDRQYKSARYGSLKLVRELEKVRGYTFSWPCGSPSQPAPIYEQANFD